MKDKHHQISRRTVLKGLGVSMCIPWLESLTSSAAMAAGRSKAIAVPPIRMAALYMPNGVNIHTWEPKGIGQAYELSPTLAPLANVKSEVLVLTELMNQHSTDGDGHYAKVAPWLTGTHITKTTGSNLRCGGVSLDQVVAQRVGNMTPLPSLELSIEPITMGVDTNVGFTRLYGSHISWSDPSTPVSREINPQLAFDRIFCSHTGNSLASSSLDKSILDLVAEDAKQLQTKVGSEDKRKLEEYFESVRAVEKRIAFDARKRADEYSGDPLARKEIDKLGGRIKDYYQDPARLSERSIDHTEQVRIMLDIMVLAFWTDTTRVATFMFANEVSGKNFSFIPGVSGGHHQISHHENDKSKLQEYHLINRWHIQQYAYMLEKMKSIKESNGTLLDNSMVLFGSAMKDGNAHSPYNLPVVLAGKGGGSIASGRHLIYPEKSPLCDLYRSMLRGLGCPVEHIGDDNGELTGFSDPSFNGLPQKV